MGGRLGPRSLKERKGKNGGCNPGSGRVEKKGRRGRRGGKGREGKGEGEVFESSLV